MESFDYRALFSIWSQVIISSTENQIALHLFHIHFLSFSIGLGNIKNNFAHSHMNVVFKICEK